MFNLPKNTLLACLWLYRVAISNYLPGMCRFEPSCSRYAGDAIKEHGIRRGVGMTATRLARCHPFAEGGYDPVPPAVENVL